MAQTGYTPIQLYYSSTTTNAPTAGNLAGGELAINITDGKLFYKDNANAVQVIAWKTTPTSAGGTGLTSYTAGDTLYYASGTTLTKLAIGTAYQAFQVNAGATAPSWQPSASSVLTTQGDLLYASGANTLARLAKDANATRYLSNTGTTNNPAWAQINLTNGVTGILPVANGGTGVTTSTGTGDNVLATAPTLVGNVTMSTGKLLVGTSSIPSQQAVIYRTDSSTANGSLRLDGNGNYAGIQFAQSGNVRGSLSTDAAALYMTHESNLYFNTGSSGNVGGTNRMLIDSSGIVTMSAYGAGAATFSAAGVISSVSDETWKIKDGVPTNPDAMLKKLEPGYWYYNDEKKETFGADRQLGFYAQNVNAAIGPEAAPTPKPITTKNKDGSETTVTKPWGYYDRSVLAITVMSLQKALATIETLTARITALEAQ